MRSQVQLPSDQILASLLVFPSMLRHLYSLREGVECLAAAVSRRAPISRINLVDQQDLFQGHLQPSSGDLAPTTIRDLSGRLGAPRQSELLPDERARITVGMRV